MTPYYQEPNHILYRGHALEVLHELPSESVDCCMTSPPYWGLRTYKTEPIIWGNEHCGGQSRLSPSPEHEWVTEDFRQHAGRGDCQSSKKYSEQKPIPDMILKRDFCLKCNAWRGELGLEPTIELYISHLILIFSEVKRVLKKTGTCWVNIADSYCGGQVAGSRGESYIGSKQATNRGTDDMLGKAIIPNGISPKSLCAIPERFMLAMMAQGWICRNDIIWYKANPMPESVKDRFTGTYEHLYFFVKNKKYWFEQQFEKTTLVATNVVQYEYGQENLPSMQEKSTYNGVLPTQESERSKLMVQGLHKGKGQGVEKNAIRSGEFTQSSVEVGSIRSRTKETQGMAEISTEKGILEGIHAVAKGKRKAEETKSIGIREGNKQEILPNTKGQDGLDSEIAQETKHNDRVGCHKSRRLGTDTQEVQEPLCLLRDENKEIDDRPYNSDKQRWDKQQEQSSSCLPQLQFYKARQNTPNISTRNLRDVWEIPTFPYPEAHFATYPEKLCETPILSGCPSMICTKCGKSREKVIEINVPDFPKSKRAEPYSHGTGKSCLNVSNSKNYKPEIVDKGYSDCGCNAPFEAGIVLDPFAGSGTTLAVAKRLNRKSIGIELNPDYCKLAQDRISKIPMPMELKI